MINILIHRCSRKDMYEAYDTILKQLFEIYPSSLIKPDRPVGIIYVNGIMKLNFRSGNDAIKLKGLRSDYINTDSHIVSDEMYYRCMQDNPVIDDIYKFIYRIIGKRNKNTERIKLNELNDKTKKVIHLMVTSLCNRNCNHCCNKQYDLNNIPYVTDSELKDAEVLCLTGGEPFLFTNPCAISEYYKKMYPNIKKVYVYTNATELGSWISMNDKLYSIDGVNVSIKNLHDRHVFDAILANNYWINDLTDNRLYIFDNLMPENTGNFEVIHRSWQKDFEPADDSIFRRI